MLHRYWYRSYRVLKCVASGPAEGWGGAAPHIFENYSYREKGVFSQPIPLPPTHFEPLGSPPFPPPPNSTFEVAPPSLGLCMELNLWNVQLFKNKTFEQLLSSIFVSPLNTDIACLRESGENMPPFEVREKMWPPINSPALPPLPSHTHKKMIPPFIGQTRFLVPKDTTCFYSSQNFQYQKTSHSFSKDTPNFQYQNCVVHVYSLW